MSWRAAISRNVRELRFCCCNAGENGKGVRNFYRNNYAELKTLNPSFPLLLREGNGIDPYMLATYDFGLEQRTSLVGLSEDEIAAKVEAAVMKGSSMPRSPVQPSFRSIPPDVVDV
ncbi:unnamed protein product [Choristocarpus tenellus]